MDFWNRIEQARSAWNVLEHPFYERWSAGQLTRSELATYAGEYRHAVVALAAAAAQTAHAAEEAAHVELWDDFTRAVGGDCDASPAPETAACAEAWADPERSELATQVALYAIESGQPAIAETKRAGLRAHYGVDDPLALAYFDVHAVRDHEHAAAHRASIEPSLAEADVDALVAQAERVLQANWRLLDGVERRNGR